MTVIMHNIDELLKQITNGRSEADHKLILSAYNLAKQYAQNCNTPYNEQCDYSGLIVAEILHDLKLDTNSLLAGIIYYAHHYGNLTTNIINQHFGVEIVKLIEKLQQLDTVSQNPFKNKNEPITKNTLHNLRNMLIAIVGDVRIVLIKLAIHTCNMRLVANQKSEICQALAYEAREIYAPLANRLGVGKIKQALENLAFKFLEPESYTSIVKSLDESKVNNEEYITAAIEQLKQAFLQQQLFVELQGRVKHIFSIWKKMQNKMIGYNELHDIHAVRVLVETVTDCYIALGIVHTLWRHIPKAFDDYIACPKENGYQSLHTTVIGPYGKILEVQIRTKDMHKMAELGIAAHWRYKEGSKQNIIEDKNINYLRQMVAWQSELTNDLETEEALKTELFEDRIYIFTPKGDIIDLPSSATAIDLAYQIHTDVGHRCRGAKANGKIIPISQPLITGMQVEILTSKERGPSRDWLNPHIKYLVTSKARAKIQQWFKSQDREQNIQVGRDIINKEFRRLGITKINFKELAAIIIGSNSDEDLLAGLGSGEIRVARLFDALQKLNHVHSSQAKQEHVKPTATNEQSKHQEAGIIIDGVDGLKYRIAKCCAAKLQDEIVGYITIGNGVSIHKKDCLNILQNSKTKQNRLIEVAWKHNKPLSHLVDIIIKAYDRKGLLRDITTVLANEDVNVVTIKNFDANRSKIIKFKICFKMTNVSKLSVVLFRIYNIANVVDVYRIYEHE